MKLGMILRSTRSISLKRHSLHLASRARNARRARLPIQLSRSKVKTSKRSNRSRLISEPNTKISRVYNLRPKVSPHRTCIQSLTNCKSLSPLREAWGSSSLIKIKRSRRLSRDQLLWTEMSLATCESSASAVASTKWKISKILRKSAQMVSLNEQRISKWCLITTQKYSGSRKPRRGKRGPDSTLVKFQNMSWKRLTKSLRLARRHIVPKITSTSSKWGTWESSWSMFLGGPLEETHLIRSLRSSERIKVISKSSVPSVQTMPLKLLTWSRFLVRVKMHRATYTRREDPPPTGMMRASLVLQG